MSATDAMNYCQAVHDLRQFPVNVGSPQTQQQRDQVERVLRHVESLRSRSTENIPDLNAIPQNSSSETESLLACHENMIGSPNVFRLDLLHQI